MRCDKNNFPDALPVLGSVQSRHFIGIIIQLSKSNYEINMKTDDQVKQEVNAELNWEPSVHAAQIGVAVKDGVVTLTGHVNNYTEKLHAVRAVQRVSGAQAIAVELDVKLNGDSRRDDADIARTARNVLDWVSILPLESVMVVVEEGWITLSGKVEWQYQRVAAKTAVQHLMGVTGVTNEISIDPISSPSVVKADIEAALLRSAQADAKHIHVEVNGKDVTLTGTVHSWSERDSVRHSAWNSPGVRTVTDNLIVSV
ncbi:osmotically-inducible protein OsmY [Oxalobacteraceae bacterium GrIS 2.11]